MGFLKYIYFFHTLDPHPADLFNVLRTGHLDRTHYREISREDILLVLIELKSTELKYTKYREIKLVESWLNFQRFSGPEDEKSQKCPQEEGATNILGGGECAGKRPQGGGVVTFSWGNAQNGP